MKISPYLSFDRQCKEAFQFYEKCLGAKIVFMMTMGESPMAAQMPKEAHDKIMHATLMVDGMALSGADTPDGKYQAPRGCAVLLAVDDVERAERIYKDLAEGGKVQMEIQETFWAKRFGMLVDRFGIPWMVNCEKPMPPA